MMMNLMSNNMAAMMAEDAGAPELRNPLNSCMQTKGFFIHKDDLREWLMRNTVMVHDEKAKNGSQRPHR